MKTLIFLFVVCVWVSFVYAVPTQLGFVINDNVPVYADSSKQTAVLETLQLTDYRFVYGDTTGEGYRYNFNGWSKIAVNDSTTGWVNFHDLLITKAMSCYINKGARLYSGPDTLSENYTLNYDEQRGVFEIHKQGDYSWVKFDFGRNGRWILQPTDTLHINVNGYYQAVVYALSDTTSYRFNVSKNIFHGYSSEIINLEQAEKFVLKLKEITDPYSTINALPGIHYNYHLEFGAGAFINKMLVDVYKIEQRWQDSIAILQETILKYPHQKLITCFAGALEYLRMAEIYYYQLDDLENALECYHQIIENYHDVVLGGYDYREYVDIRAAERINFLIRQQSFEYLDFHADKMINESRNPAVKLIATKSKLLSLVMQHEFQKIVHTTRYILADYPNEIKVYINHNDNSKNFSVELAETMFDILRAHGKYDEYKMGTDYLISYLKNYPIAGYGAFKIAELADFFHNDNQYITTLYHTVLDSFPEFVRTDTHFTNWNDRFIEYSSKRINVLNEFKSQTVKILHNDTPLYITKLDTIEPVTVLDKGEIVTELSNDFYLGSNNLSLYASDYLPRFYKVMLSDSTIGWIKADALTSVSSFEPAIANDECWSMYNGNASNNRYFSGPDINDPQVRELIYAEPFEYIRLADINSDSVLDYIVQRNSIIKVIDGKTKNVVNELVSSSQYPGHFIIDDHRKLIVPNGYSEKCLRYIDPLDSDTLWQVETGDTRNPVVFQDRLYHISPDTLVQCTSTVDGEPVWSTAIDKKYPKDIAANENAVIVTGYEFVTALDPDNGKVLWSKELDLEYHSYDLTPVIDSHSLYLMIEEYTFASIDLRSGKINWQFKNYNQCFIELNPIVTNDYVVYSPCMSQIFVLNKYTGEYKWQHEFRPLMESYCVGGNTIFAQLEVSFHDETSLEPNIYALNLNTGKARWVRHFENNAQIVYQGGNLYLSGESGLVIITDNGAGSTPDETGFHLFPNYPNPFNNHTIIQYSLESFDYVNVDIFNVLGQKVVGLFNGLQEAGMHTILWEGNDHQGNQVSNGIYFYRIKTFNKSSTKSMLLLK